MKSFLFLYADHHLTYSLPLLQNSTCFTNYIKQLERNWNRNYIHIVGEIFVFQAVLIYVFHTIILNLDRKRKIPKIDAQIHNMPLKILASLRQRWYPLEERNISLTTSTILIQKYFLTIKFTCMKTGILGKNLKFCPWCLPQLSQ